MTTDDLNARIQADLDAVGWGTSVSPAGLAVTDSALSRQGRVHADIYLPVIREMFPSHDRFGRVPAGSFAEGTAVGDGYVIQAIQTGKIPILRAALTEYAKKYGMRAVNNNHLSELFDEFTKALSVELISNNVVITPARVLSLLAFRYARALGETVNAAHSPLPHLVYEYIAADVEPNIILLNFSKRLNPYTLGNGRLVVPPIPLEDAKRLGRVPAQMLEDLYVTKTEF